jgi:hypothetical protein
MSDPKAVIIHHHQAPLLCPSGNYRAIMARTGRATVRWNTLYFHLLDILKSGRIRKTGVEIYFSLGLGRKHDLQRMINHWR